MLTPNNNNNNPFQVKSPEDITAEDAVGLFVPMYNDYPKLLLPENTFINGPRGSGKSMMFRFMEADCQCLHKKVQVNELSFFSVYIPIKVTEFQITEFEKLKDHANFLLNEHILCTHFATKCFEVFSKTNFENSKEKVTQLKEFFNVDFARRLKVVGYKESLPNIAKVNDINKLFLIIRNICEDLYTGCLNYCNIELGINDKTEISPYSGPLCSYLNFLHPILISICNNNILPNKPVFLLIDDADNLNKTQTKILNSWVSYRTGTRVSLKISTQLNYKTYKTVSGTTIDSPHDYSEVNIDAIYTSSKKQYKENVDAIVSKRLAHFKIDSKPVDFFPVYQKQEDAIKKIYDSHVTNFNEGKARGSKVGDDAYRYARPDYIRSLGGLSKKKSKYYYAGFEQVVHLSSGIIRFFLESASRMYSEMEKKKGKEKITCIDPTIQNNVLRDFAEEFYFAEFKKFVKDIDHYGHKTEDADKLRNLIQALGGIFSLILNSNASERRVFSIALTNVPEKEINDIFELGVKWGYFQESSIGNKEGTGRTKLYILSRRLAPLYTLDPTSFAGYKFMTNEDLRLAISNPSQLIEKVRKKLAQNPNSDISINKQIQMEIFRQ